MDLYSALGFAAAAAVVGFTVRRFEREAGRMLTIAAGAIVMLSVLAAFSGVLGDLGTVASEGGLGGGELLTAMKAVGIAYLSRLASSLCRDLEESSLADICDLTGRVLIVVTVLPLMRSIAEAMTALVNELL